MINDKNIIYMLILVFMMWFLLSFYNWIIYTNNIFTMNMVYTEDVDGSRFFGVISLIFLICIVYLFNEVYKIGRNNEEVINK
jgi:hypothetical protein